MPCKHEGGKDSCIRDRNRCCIVRHRQTTSAWAVKNRINAKCRATSSDAGESGEYLVAHDLLYRGLQVTKPLNRNGSDDLHAKFSVGWLTIQVKLGSISESTGTINIANSTRVTSDVLAMVDLRGKRIRYIGWKADLPVELQ